MKMSDVMRPLSVGLALAGTAVPVVAAADLVPIYTFQRDKDGSQPRQIVFGKDGAIYGVTYFGGSDNRGTVFRLDPPASGNKWKLTTLHSFSGDSDGAHPVGIVFGNDGELYGATNGGGGTDDLCLDGCGTVFQLTLHNNKETIIHRFDGADGKFPFAEPVLHNGSLYVTASYGGEGTGGTVLRLDPPSRGGKLWQPKVLHHFDATSYNLRAPITFVADDIYGTTYNGGSTDDGTVFKLSPKPGTDKWKFEVVVYLQPTMWANPQAPLLYRKGAIYGTATSGGLGYGAVFGFGAGSNGDKPILYTFKGGSDGETPLTLTFAPAGNALYGVTEFGGDNGDGTIYKLSRKRGAWQKKTVWDFTDIVDGAHPLDLIVGPDGLLYGTCTDGGGAGSTGVVYKFQE